MKLLASFLLSAMVFCSGVSARAEGSSMGSFRQNFATVIFSGLGGAVLGLSTLSFIPEPQEHIGNIWMGMALGIIVVQSMLLKKQQVQTMRNHSMCR